MRLSELRACDHCGRNHGLTFNVVRVSVAIVKPRAAGQVAGLVGVLGGSAAALGVAEALAPDSDAVLVACDENRELLQELQLCTGRCVELLGGPLSRLETVERQREELRAGRST